MAESAPQNYKNHQKFVPMYHYVAAAIVVLNFGWWTYRTLTAFSMDHLVLMVLGFGVILVGFFARGFPNKNQDRIIRLEERMRFGELLPDDLKAHVNEFTTAQLIALRFASGRRASGAGAPGARREDGESRGHKEACEGLAGRSPSRLRLAYSSFSTTTGSNPGRA